MFKKKIIMIAFVLLTGLAGVLALQSSFADTGLIKLQPSSGTTQKGSNFSVNIVVDPGTSIDGVEAQIGYNKSQLQFVSIDAGGSAFPIELAQSGGNGTVQVTRGILGDTVSANGSFVAKVTFKALVGGATANLDLSGNTTASGAYQNPATQDGQRTLTNPSTPDPDPDPEPEPEPEPDPDKPKPDNPGSKPDKPSDGGGDNGGSENPSKPRDEDKPPVTKPNNPERLGRRTIKLLPPAFRRLIFELSGGNAFRAYVVYGSGEELNLSTPITKLSTKHNIKLNEKLLVPGTEYKYKVVIKEKNGKTTESQIKSVKTKGYTVRTKILGGDNSPLINKLVTLHSDPITSRTDEDGIATFNDVSPGKHSVVYVEDGQEYKEIIQVLDTVKSAIATSAEPQTFAVVYGEVSSRTLNPGLIAALAGAIVAVGFALVFSIGKFSNKKMVGNYAAPTGSESYGQSNAYVGGNQGVQSGNNEVNEMLNRVEGGKKSDPGTVVAPNDNDK